MSSQFSKDMNSIMVLGRYDCSPAVEIIERMKKLKREHAAMKKARKIDAYALAKELGPKISLNLNEWKLIAKAVEEQLEKRK